MHNVVFIFLICFSLSNPRRKKLEEKKLLRLGSNALCFSFWKVNICVTIYRTPKATVKWSQHKISWMDSGHRKTTIKILSTLLWQYSKLELWIKHLSRKILPKIQAWNIAVEYIAVPVVLLMRKFQGTQQPQWCWAAVAVPPVSSMFPMPLCAPVFTPVQLLSLQSLAFSQPRPCPWKAPAGLWPPTTFSGLFIAHHIGNINATDMYINILKNDFDFYLHSC